VKIGSARSPVTLIVIGLAVALTPVYVGFSQRATREAEVGDVAALRASLDSVRVVLASARTAADSARLAEDISSREYFLSRREYHVVRQEQSATSFWRMTGPATIMLITGIFLVVAGLELLRRRFRVA